MAPWVRDWVRTRREVRVARRHRIDEWRRTVSGIDFNDISVAQQFMTSPEYSSLRLHMQDSFIAKLERARTLYIGAGRGRDVRKHMLLDEISRLEKQWGLL